MNLRKDWRRILDDARDEGVAGAHRVRGRLARDERRGPWPNLLIAGLGAAAGAATLYLLDPDRGKRRRAMLRDRGVATARRAGGGAARGGRMVGSFVGGKIQAIQYGGEQDVMPNDAALAAKVESELFRDAAVPKGSINVNAEQGIVVLRGEVADAEMRERLELAARRIPGVWEVSNLLHLPGEPAQTAR